MVECKSRRLANCSRRRIVPPLMHLVLAVVLLVLAPAVNADFFFPSSSGDQQAGLKATVALRQRQQKEFLAWVNGTVPSNFSLTPDPFDTLKYHLAPLHNGTAPGAYWRNITGIFSGRWDPAVDLSHSLKAATSGNLTHRGSFPWSGGRTTFDLNEEYELPKEVSVVRGSLSIASNRSGVRAIDFDIDGLHYLKSGRMLLIALPHEDPHLTDPRDVLAMVPANDLALRNLTINAVNSTFATRIKRVSKQIAAGQQDNSGGGTEGDGTVEKPAHHCSFHIYGQLRPVGPVELTPEMDLLEHELADPQGLSHIRSPPLVLDSVFYSRNCALLLPAPEAVGETTVQFWNKVVRYALSLFAVQFGLAWLLASQMDASRTPSRLAKVSHYTFMMQWSIDFFLAVTHLSVGIVSDNQSSIPLIAASFMSVILCIAFTHRYVHSILSVQGPEHQPAAEAATPAPAPATAPAETADETGNATTPVAAGPNNIATPDGLTVPTPPSLLERSRAFVRGRGFKLSAFAFVFYIITFYPIFTLTLIMPGVYSFWIPQIVRNTRRGTRNAIQARYVVGATAGRLFVPLYLLACPSSVIRPFIDSSVWVYLLALYLVLQAAVLLLQDFLGAVFFLPATYRRNAASMWEWHPPRASLGVYTPGSTGKERLDALQRAGNNGEDMEADESAEHEDAPMLTSGAEDGDAEATPYSYGVCAICLSSIEPLDTLAQQRAQAHRLAQHAEHHAAQEGGSADAESTLFEYDEEAELDSTPRQRVDARSSRPYPPEKDEPATSGLPIASTSTARVYPEALESRTSHISRRTGALIVSRLVPVLTRIQLSLGPLLDRLRSVSSARLSDRAIEIMVAPCGHIFHTPCLQQWLNIKTECPTCRRPLPPI